MLKEMLLNNRSCRCFDESRVVTREELIYMVECARLTPSSVNSQPFVYRLVNDPSERSLVQPLTKWAGLLPELHLPPEGHRPTAFLIICQDTEKFGSVDKFPKDIGITALAISLAAAEQGLASCMIGSFDREKLATVLKLPAHTVPLLVIGIGKSDEACRIVEAQNGETRYYRDADGTHIVPKRPLNEIIL